MLPYRTHVALANVVPGCKLHWTKSQHTQIRKFRILQEEPEGYMCTGLPSAVICWTCLRAQYSVSWKMTDVSQHFTTSKGRRWHRTLELLTPFHTILLLPAKTTVMSIRTPNAASLEALWPQICSLPLHSLRPTCLKATYSLHDLMVRFIAADCRKGSREQVFGLQQSPAGPSIFSRPSSESAWGLCLRGVPV